MRVFVSGATGFIGQRLVDRLLERGDEICAWVRDVDRARGLLGPSVDLLQVDAPARELEAAVGEADAVVNLAGEPIVGARWTERRKRSLISSRVDPTEALVDALRASSGPRVLVSASAVGIFGDRGDEVLDEESAIGEGFLAELGARWEGAALRARESGLRVACLRFGIVLGEGGGALSKLLPIFRYGLGGALGGGRQYVSWIHLDDVTELLLRALDDEQLEGPICAVAPNPITNRELTVALSRAVRRWAPFRVPRIALRLAYGEGAQVLLDSQRVTPARLLSLGFEFRYPTIESALVSIVG